VHIRRRTPYNSTILFNVNGVVLDYFTEAVGINPGSHQFAIDFKYQSGTGSGVQLHSGHGEYADHVSFELQNGKQVFDFATSDVPVRIVSDDGSDADNRWHIIAGTRHGQNSGSLQVCHNHWAV
jgi:hypothetical protein